MAEADANPPRGSAQVPAFVASAAMRLGIYVLRPPEHSPTLLANAQTGWLRSPEAVSRGWQPLSDVTTAQTRANLGDLFLAAFENPDPHKPGHIAIVRPSDIDTAALLAEGPFIIQAGRLNALSMVRPGAMAGSAPDAPIAGSNVSVHPGTS